jgi:hypothetical protein
MDNKRDKNLIKKRENFHYYADIAMIQTLKYIINDIAKYCPK